MSESSESGYDVAQAIESYQAGMRTAAEFARQMQRLKAVAETSQGSLARLRQVLPEMENQPL